MEHKERNEQIRQKILAEIADIEAFSRQREVQKTIREDIPILKTALESAKE